MKNTYNLILVFLLLTVVVSCNNAIDIQQPGTLGSENAFKTVENLRSGLLGAYNFLDTASEIGFSAAFTDESFRGRESGGQNNNELNFNINSSNGYAQNIWRTNYAALGLANRIIEASVNINRNEDPSEYDNVLGQAHCIRAFALFQILTYFSTDYTDVNALAGVLVTETPDDVFGNQQRATNGEFYAQIESDLNRSASLITTNEGNTFMGQDFITALRARMALYREQYNVADGLAASLLANYPIANQAQYTAMFNDTDNTEVIFKLERSVGDSFDGQGLFGLGWAGSLFAFIDPSDGGGPFMEMSRSVFNILNGTNDVRLSRNLNVAESTVDIDYTTNDNFLNDDVLLVFKYPGSDNQPLMNDLKVFRSSEMLLIRAEAAAQANDFAGAAAFIKQLRDARFGAAQTAPVFTTQEEAFGGILDERRLEFLFEGHRWVDLKRLGARGNRAIDRDAKECSILSGCTLPSSDFRFTLPIPITEISGNTGIQQNPNY